jgi:valyl-tRNA synthetase
VLPFVTEEVWSWWQEGTVHRAPWPTAPATDGDVTVLQVAAEAIAAVRKAKSDAKLSMRAEVSTVRVTGPAERLDLIRAVAADVQAAGRIASVEFTTEPGAGSAGVRYDVVL